MSEFDNMLSDFLEKPQLTIIPENDELKSIVKQSKIPGARFGVAYLAIEIEHRMTRVAFDVAVNEFDIQIDHFNAKKILTMRDLYEETEEYNIPADQVFHQPFNVFDKVSEHQALIMMLPAYQEGRGYTAIKVYLESDIDAEMLTQMVKDAKCQVKGNNVKFKSNIIAGSFYGDFREG